MTAEVPAGGGRESDATPSVVVVGAGISGLVAARQLTAAGWSVRVIDKGRSVGGRMATRRIGEARLDHGAQFFTVRTPAFQAQVDDWLDRGLVTVWCHGFDDVDGHPRYVAADGMNALAKDLATGLDIECSTMAFAVRPTGDPTDLRPTHLWEVAIDDGSARPADAVIVTAPLPQAFALLVDSGIELDGSLMFTDYDRTIGLLVLLDRPSAVPAPGGVQLTGGTTGSLDGAASGETPFSFVGDNAAKGISAAPAVTFHASPAWSEEHWDDEPDALRGALLAAAAPWIGEAAVVDAQVKKWRFATPRAVWPDPCWVAPRIPAHDGKWAPVVVAGDAFAGPRVEGAHNSGLAAAHALLG